MRTLDTGKDKIQKICDKLRHETLEPAFNERDRIIEEAEAKAQEIIGAARKESEEIIHAGRRVIEQERNVFESTLKQSAKKAIGQLRQSIEKTLVNSELFHEVTAASSSASLVGKLLEAIVAAVEKEGVSAKFQAVLPKSVPAEALAGAMAKGALSRLEKGAVAVGDFGGGVQMRLLDKKITLDLSDQMLKDLLGQYVKSDFRALLFGE